MGDVQVKVAPDGARWWPAGAATGVLGVGALLACTGLVACSRHYIVNTDVEDTESNRSIVAFCERYRKAVERQDVPTLLALASAQYYDNGGNVDATDDIDYAGLESYLENEFATVKSIRHEIRYRRVSREDDFIYVDYTYSGSFRVKTSGGDKWRSTVEENRLELVRDGDSYRIVAGM